ncbi:pseudoazurin [Pseudomonas matsuisoli]|uniref:Pseudoazurin n=1 Tax=Pseudomonas matsuisoli TaxID=1515666 RepID=A0A917PV10_9PSED|nr:pseudoazurin [Pseudomonas matsuisoli]GGJ93068.1 pseudoazurin [Pseudomonas matsuisoli]
MIKVLAALLALASPLAFAQTYEVKMLNRGAAGSMIYEPDFLDIALGDSVKFIATHSTHNAASIPGIAPEGAPAFKGKINEEITVRFDESGVYGIECIPHLAMGMVMLVRVGGADVPAPAIPESLPDRAIQRLNAIVQREFDR